LENKSNFKSIGLGCLLGFLTLVVISVFSMLLLFALSQVLPVLNHYAAGLMFIFIAIAFVLGSLVFLQRAAPGICIRGIGGMKDIVIAPKKAGNGIRSLRAVKILVGAVTWVSVYLIFLALMLFQNPSSAIVIVLVLIGLVLGPMAAWLVGRRTSMVVPEKMQ